jgi:hypothetical protein
MGCRFTLLARGGLLVSASIRGGRVGFVELLSQAGAECRLRNPFDGPVTLYRDGRKAEALSGTMLRFPTRKGERVVALAANARREDAGCAIPGD